MTQIKCFMNTLLAENRCIQDRSDGVSRMTDPRGQDHGIGEWVQTKKHHQTMWPELEGRQ